MAILTTGPIDEDQLGGDITDIQLKAFNNTANRIIVVLRVYDTSLFPPTQIDSVSSTLDPYDRDTLTATTNSVDNILVQIEHSLGRDDVYLTVYGRNCDGVTLPGATYRHTELVEGGVGIVD